MNSNTLVIVADSARARLFRIQRTDAPRAPIRLLEAESLVHPEARVKEVERHSGSFPSAVRPGKAGQGHTLDDHRGAHAEEERRRFARAIAESVRRSVKEHSYNPVIAVATHAMHSLLESELARDLPKDVQVRSEIGEWSQLSPSELLEELQDRGAFQP
jgi:protein required for attachment to host cells